MAPNTVLRYCHPELLFVDVRWGLALPCSYLRVTKGTAICQQRGRSGIQRS